MLCLQLATLLWVLDPEFYRVFQFFFRHVTHLCNSFLITCQAVGIQNLSRSAVTSRKCREWVNLEVTGLETLLFPWQKRYGFVLHSEYCGCWRRCWCILEPDGGFWESVETYSTHIGLSGLQTIIIENQAVPNGWSLTYVYSNIEDK